DNQVIFSASPILCISQGGGRKRDLVIISKMNIGRTTEIVMRDLADGGAYVACDPQTIVGCVFYHVRPDHLYLDRLAVLPGHRGQGIGKALIRTVEERPRQYGLGDIRLSVRLALENQRAYNERLGYTFLNYGRHPGYTTPTSVMLHKQLKSAAP